MCTKNIDKTEDERKRMKQKWLNRKVKSALRKRDDSWLNWKRHKSNEIFFNLPQDEKQCNKY